MTEEPKTPRTRTTHLPRPRRERVLQRKKARSWLRAERRQHAVAHHVTFATARVALPVPKVLLVRRGRTIVTDTVNMRRGIRRHGYILELSSRHASALALVEATAKSVANAGVAIEKMINASSPDAGPFYSEWLRQLRVSEHVLALAYLRAEAAVENLPPVPHPFPAAPPVDPGSLRVPFPASRAYPVLATCTSPRRQAVAARRAPGVADQLRHATLSASERGVEAAEARSLARLQKILTAQTMASIVSTGKAVVASA